MPVCEGCLDSIRHTEIPTCHTCGERLPVVPGAEEAVCELCRRIAPQFHRAVAYGSYNGALRDLIHLLKYEHVHPAASLLGRMVAEVAAPLVAEIGFAPIVVPVPLHASKRRQRGFNQSEEIARVAVKTMSHEPFGIAGLALRTDLMERVRATESQTGLTPHQRRENIRGAFSMLKATEVAGRIVLLIDDVLTTGTTAGECARVLHRAGAEKVYVATVARVLKQEAAWARVEVRKEEAPRAVVAHAG